MMFENPKKYLALTILSISLGYANQSAVHIDTDFGFDADDQLALINVSRETPDLLVSTTLYQPDEKAAIVTLALEGNPAIVAAGYGAYESDMPSFLEKYPTWPLAFGNPEVVYDSQADFQNYFCLYPHQTKAYRENYGEEIFAAHYSTVNKNDLASLRNYYLQQSDASVTMISLAPCHNLADLVSDPEVARKVKKIVMMGGWFGSIDAPGRLGYNTVLSLESSQKIFNSGLPVTLVTSALCQNFTLDINSLRDPKHQPKTQLGKTLLDAAINWEIHRSRKTQRPPATCEADLKLNNPILADVLTAFLALHPEYIKTTENIRIELYPEKVLENPNDRIHMLHPRASELFKVFRVDESSIQVVTEVANPDDVKQKLTEHFFSLLEGDL